MTTINKRFYDESFKRMAVELSYAKGAVKPVAEELGIEPGRLSKWRQRASAPKEKAADFNPGSARDKEGAKRTKRGTA